MFCRSCGYPLEQSSATRCPECGRRFDVTDPTTYASAPRWRLALLRSSLLLAAVGTAVALVLWGLFALIYA